MTFRSLVRKEDVIGAGLALAVFGAFVVPLAFADLEARRPPAPSVVVVQENRHFIPNTLEIARGTVVIVVNNDTFTHHVYVKSPLMNFDSGEEPVGASVDLEFDHAGTFNVLCAIHPTMHLRVTVH